MASALLNVTILQRMSDARYGTAEACGGTWANGTCWLSAQWQAVAVAGLTAVADFNARKSTHVPGLGSALVGCDKQIAFTLLDSGSTGATSLSNVAPDLLSGTRPDLIIGPARSASTAPVAGLAGAIDLPQIGYWATAPTFTDQTFFPSYMRTIPHDTVTGNAVCRLLSDLHYSHVAVLAIDDTWANGWKELLREYCPTYGVEPRIFSFPDGDTEASRMAVRNLAASASEVVLVLVLSVQLLDSIMDEALANGLIVSDSMPTIRSGTIR